LWVGMVSFVGVHSVWPVQAASSSVAGAGHAVSSASSSAGVHRLFEEMVVGGGFGGGHKRGATGEWMVSVDPGDGGGRVLPVFD
jgi:hypothetical protein